MFVKKGQRNATRFSTCTVHEEFPDKPQYNMATPLAPILIVTPTQFCLTLCL